MFDYVNLLSRYGINITCVKMIIPSKNINIYLLLEYCIGCIMSVSYCYDIHSSTIVTDLSQSMMQQELQVNSDGGVT